MNSNNPQKRGPHYLEPLLKVNNLSVCFHTEDGILTAVNNVSFHVKQGEILGVVGESGCGKSITSMSIIQLIPKPAGEITSGEIYFEGQDLLKLNSREICKVRGNKISMIFQEPMTSLNPVKTCGNQIIEALRLHKNIGKSEAYKLAKDLLYQAGIPLPEQRVKEYPHQLSGGMRQRVMIAMALACKPKLLIADEPTTALDVTIQAQILHLIKRTREESGMSIMLITHDMGVVAEMADRVIVMYAGKVMEEADVNSFFAKPLHPYTIDLLRAIPRIDKKQHRLNIIKGMVPNLTKKLDGCSYQSRCSKPLQMCHKSCPPLTEIEPGRWAACWRYLGH